MRGERHTGNGRERERKGQRNIKKIENKNVGERQRKRKKKIERGWDRKRERMK